MGGRGGGRAPRACPLARHRDRPALRAATARYRGHGGVPRPLLPHLRLAARAAGACRQAGGRHRHGRHRRAVDPGGRGGGGPSDRVPAQPELVRAAAQRSHRRRRAGADQGRIRRNLRPLPGLARRLHPRRRPAQGDGGVGGGARGVLRKALRRARIRHLDGQFPRHLRGRGCQPHGVGVRRPQDPRARPRPGDGREAGAEGPRVRHPPRAAGDRLLRSLQPGQCTPRRPERGAHRARHAGRHRDRRRGAQARHPGLCHRVRRRDRRLRPHRHPGLQRAEPEGKMDGRAEDLPRHPDFRLPEHVHPGRPAQCLLLLQHSPLQRAECRVGGGVHPPSARARREADGGERGRRSRVDRTCP